jgi:hypothetical protein
MALAYTESTPETPLLCEDPNWKRREDTIFKKAALFYKDYGTAALILVKTDQGYDIFEPVKGIFNEFTSRIVRDVLSRFSWRFANCYKAIGP